MSKKPFKFREFTIHQDKTAMKVGTDGVLLGAWMKMDPEIDSILDIGTGTGLIALQAAQRSDCHLIDAIEIEPHAYEQAVENFEDSSWADRLFCYHTSIEEFANEMDETYDLIVSNPPFYTATVKDHAITRARANARHVQSLSYKDLLKNTSRLLSEKGTCAFIIPFDEEDGFLKLSSQYELYPEKITRVKGNHKSKFKRSLIQLSFSNKAPLIDALVIEIERHIYTEEYKKLVDDFYLKVDNQNKK